MYHPSIFLLAILVQSVLYVTGQQQIYTSTSSTQGTVTYETGIATTPTFALYNIQLIPVTGTVSNAIIHYTVSSLVNPGDAIQQNVYCTVSNGIYVYPVQLHPSDQLDYSFTFFDSTGAGYNTAGVSIQTAVAPTTTQSPITTIQSTQSSVTSYSTNAPTTSAAPVSSSTQNGNVGGIYYTTSVVTAGNQASIQLSVSPTGTQLGNAIIHYTINNAQTNIYMSLQGNIYTKQLLMNYGDTVTYSFTLFAATGPAYDTSTISYTLTSTTASAAPTITQPATTTAAPTTTVTPTTLPPTTVATTGITPAVGGTGTVGGLSYAYSVSNTASKTYSINFNPQSGTCTWAIVHYTINGVGAQNVGMIIDTTNNAFTYTVTLNTNDVLQYGFTFDITNGPAYDTPVYAYSAGSTSTTGSPVTVAPTTTAAAPTTIKSTTQSPTTTGSATTGVIQNSTNSTTTGGVNLQNSNVGGVAYTTSIAFSSGNLALIQFTPTVFSSIGWVNLHYTVGGGGAYNVGMQVYKGNSFSYTVQNLPSTGTVTYSFTFWATAPQAAYDTLSCTYAYNTLTCQTPTTTGGSTSSGSGNPSTSTTSTVVSITPKFPSTAPICGAIVQPSNIDTTQCAWSTYDTTFTQWFAAQQISSNGNYQLTGQRVLLQSSVTLTAPLQILNGGTLVFDNADITLTVPSIVMELSGALIIGTAACPFVKHANIFISGSANSNAIQVDYDYGSIVNQGTAMQGGEPTPGSFGNRVIGVGSGGTISLHGSKGVRAHGGVTWTYLAQTANVGDTVIVVDGAIVDWTAGDYIVIASSDYEPNHSETGLIKSITGNTITLSAPLVNQHWGQTLTYDGRSVNLRAEVGLLSRNIQIQPLGVVNDTLPGYGAHMMFRRGFTAVQIEGVQLWQFGQGGVMGRYPIHFHLCVNTPNNTRIIDNTIWDSQTRWVTIHGSNNVFVQGNVGFLSFGAGYFLEDGVETSNTFDMNLGVVARPAATNYFWNPYNVPPIQNFDQVNPTIFWITNMYNTITNNAAVGASAVGRGYWLIGCAAKGQSAALWSSDFQNIPYSNGINSPLYKFSGNTAHSNFLGIDTVPPPDYSNIDTNIVNPNIPPYNAAMFSSSFGLYQPQISNGYNLIAIINNCTVFRSRGAQTFAAVWLRPYWFWFNNSVLADNMMGYVSMVSAGDPSGVATGFYGVSSHILYIGLSESAVSWEPSGSFRHRSGSVNTLTGSQYPSQLLMERRGHQFYDGPAHIYNASFHNWYPTPHPLGTFIPGTNEVIQVNNTAIGWFLPNIYLYPAAFTSLRAKFTNVTIRHFVYSQQIADLYGQVLLDGDKQTFLLDGDGTLTGAIGSTQINDYIFNRGPEYTQECLTASTCMSSPVSYLNGHIIIYNNQSVIQHAALYNEANNQTIVLDGVNTRNIRQFFLLSMKQNRYQINITPAVNLMFIRLLNGDQNDYVDYDWCVGTGLQLSQITVTLGQLENDAYTNNPQEGFVAASDQSPLIWSYINGNVYVHVIQTQHKASQCYPVGSCISDPNVPNQCMYNPSVAPFTGCQDVASCNWMCATYGNGYTDCPVGGCPTVQISISGNINTNPQCAVPYNPYNLALRQTTMVSTNVAIDPYFPNECTAAMVNSANSLYTNSFSTGAFDVSTAAGNSTGLYGNYSTAVSVGLTAEQAIQIFGQPVFIPFTNKTTARKHSMRTRDIIRLQRRATIHAM